uniref:Uncharacterized protein n=1 Tax=Anguilla anguilla TaxID=7936 RepID=A0A0E9UYW2_ANGAN
MGITGVTNPLLSPFIRYSALVWASTLTVTLMNIFPCQTGSNLTWILLVIRSKAKSHLIGEKVAMTHCAYKGWPSFNVFLESGYSSLK